MVFYTHDQMFINVHLIDSFLYGVWKNDDHGNDIEFLQRKFDIVSVPHIGQVNLRNSHLRIRESRYHKFYDYEILMGILKYDPLFP